MAECKPCQAGNIAAALSNMLTRAAGAPKQGVNGSQVITGVSPLPTSSITPTNGNVFGNPVAQAVRSGK